MMLPQAIVSVALQLMPANQAFSDQDLAFSLFQPGWSAWHKKCTTMLNFLFATNLSRRN